MLAVDVMGNPWAKKKQVDEDEEEDGEEEDTDPEEAEMTVDSQNPYNRKTQLTQYNRFASKLARLRLKERLAREEQEDGAKYDRATERKSEQTTRKQSDETELGMIKSSIEYRLAEILASGEMDGSTVTVTMKQLIEMLNGDLDA